MSNTIYENKIVAFVDILGFKNLVGQSHDDFQTQKKIMDALDIIHKHKMLNEKFEMDKLGVRTTAFSDSVIISYPLTFDGGLFFVLMDLIHIQLELLGIGIFIRGGIFIGEAFHDEKKVFGPAVVEAHILESEKAIYPRIILSDETIKKGIANSPEHQNEHDISLLLSLIKQDVDGWYYVDFLKQYPELDDYYDYYGLLGKARTYLL